MTLVRVEVLQRHGQPGSTPTYHQEAVEMGEADKVPSEELLSVLRDVLKEMPAFVGTGQACEVTVTFRPVE